MDHVSHLVLTYGYLLIFALVFFDQVAVSIPSPPFVTAMGVLSASGQFSIWAAFGVIFAAAFLADCFWFRVGLGTDAISCRSQRFKRWNERLAKAVNIVRRGILGPMLTVKFSLLPSALVPFAAGLTRLSGNRFLYIAAIGNAIFTAAYLIGGFIAGYAVLKFFGHRGALLATVGCCLLLILPAGVQWCSKHRLSFSRRIVS